MLFPLFFMIVSEIPMCYGDATRGENVVQGYLLLVSSRSSVLFARFLCVIRVAEDHWKARTRLPSELGRGANVITVAAEQRRSAASLGPGSEPGAACCAGKQARARSSAAACFVYEVHRVPNRPRPSCRCRA